MRSIRELGWYSSLILRIYFKNVDLDLILISYCV